MYSTFRTEANPPLGTGLCESVHHLTLANQSFSSNGITTFILRIQILRKRQHKLHSVLLERGASPSEASVASCRWLAVLPLPWEPRELAPCTRHVESAAAMLPTDSSLSLRSEPWLFKTTTSSESVCFAEALICTVELRPSALHVSKLPADLSSPSVRTDPAYTHGYFSKKNSRALLSGRGTLAFNTFATIVNDYRPNMSARNVPAAPALAVGSPTAWLFCSAVSPLPASPHHYFD